ncbi:MULTISPECIES: S-methyl-5'-thioinosine phosphorylase [unclassified Guyparkeria]|uniref:S-methyl-5'-thioinosine phosphorylase n=1 Tax=unclassified Guyparkeria TaxID=2626246 RepID=UPI0007337C99|nr:MULTISPECIES: S-methyl-5'-thioinosine phosphorylase [unclassified Guyparkeria]KTG17279.1 5'-methylthioadenosine phosphorylase [Guyparkeria sp. XI15]OAE87256.1 5'-methylthioadenosine phosphorylase [Guyparkeria sp. WRN-7]
MHLAIIGGTGLSQIEGIDDVRHQVVSTPFGEPSGPVTIGRLQGCDVVFLPRHGYNHRIPPHQINYRANIWALRELNVSRILAVAAVGGIHPDMGPGSLVVPDQLIDYTWGRPSTYYEGDLDSVTHVDFTYPYDEPLRQAFLKAGQALDIPMRDGGTYGATQGPRLETAAEIRRLERDGCDVVGMTGMPEAVLAREADIEYASLNVVANWAAGVHDGDTVSMDEIEKTLSNSMRGVRKVLKQILSGEDRMLCRLAAG